MDTLTSPLQPPAVAGGDIRLVPIEQIVVGKRLRPLQEDAVCDLARSIQMEWLLYPVTVRHIGDGYQLIAGNHGLEAAKQIGWIQIAAMVLEIDTIQAQLIEISENLIRAELSVLERAEHLLRSKAIYEEQYPESVRVGRRGKSAVTVTTFSKYAAPALNDMVEVHRKERVHDASRHLLKMFRSWRSRPARTPSRYTEQHSW